jgi:hypothetical protein
MSTFDTASEVISAFVDDEPFAATALAAALEAPEGRRLLIDAIALRHLVHGAGERARAVALPLATPRRWWLVAASILLPLALVAGFAAGWQTAERRSEASSDDAPPAPTRVVNDLDWQVSKGGN